MQINPLFTSDTLPVLVQPETQSGATSTLLEHWLKNERDTVDGLLDEHGAILLRGYSINSPEQFGSIANLLTGELKPYLGGDSPRSSVLKNIYTSTEFPPNMEISLHNELTYSGWWPSRVLFWCNQAPATGGQTHLADARKVYKNIDPGISSEFADKGVLYVRSYHNEGGAGKTWQQAFETDDKESVTAFCKSAGMECEWYEWGLRTLTFGPGVYTHPRTGEVAWINQADQFQAYFNTPWEDAFNPKEFSEEQLPFHAYFGDRSEIPLTCLEDIRRAGKECEVLFDWQHGDILVLDNILAMHGRKPYTGDREILVAMG